MWNGHTAWVAIEYTLSSCGPVLAQDNVGCAGEHAHVDSVAVTARVQVTAHEHLGLGVSALDA